jgi:hypothetical protein
MHFSIQTTNDAEQGRLRRMVRELQDQ